MIFLLVREEDQQPDQFLLIYQGLQIWTHCNMIFFLRDFSILPEFLCQILIPILVMMEEIGLLSIVDKNMVKIRLLRFVLFELLQQEPP